MFRIAVTGLVPMEADREAQHDKWQFMKIEIKVLGNLLAQQPRHGQQVIGLCGQGASREKVRHTADDIPPLVHLLEPFVNNTPPAAKIRRHQNVTKRGIDLKRQPAI